MATIGPTNIYQEIMLSQAGKSIKTLEGMSNYSCLSELGWLIAIEYV